MNRKLSVKKERLAELTTQELGDVAGASGAPCNQTNLCTTAISCGCGPTYYLSQIFVECVTK